MITETLPQYSDHACFFSEHWKTVGLDFSSYPNIDEAKCIERIKMYPDIRSLSFKNCSNITHILFDSLPRLCKLEFIDLRGCENLRSKDVKALQKYHELRHIGFSNISDKGLSELSQNTHLLSLSLSGCTRLTNGGLKSLASFQNLKYLKLTEATPLSNLAFKHISHLKSLEELSLSGLDFSGRHSGSLRSKWFRKLCKREGYPWFYKAEPYLQSLPHLTRLSLSGAELLEQDTRALGQLSQLKHLSLAHSVLPLAALKNLIALKKLESLDLHQCWTIRDLYMNYLAEMPWLKELNLSGAELHDFGLKKLAKITNLETLNLQDCSDITDVGIEFLSKLPSLKKLCIGDARFLTAAALESLSNLPHLESLLIYGCEQFNFNDLLILKKSPHLHHLRLEHGCILSQSEINQLQAHFQSLFITQDQENI